MLVFLNGQFVERGDARISLFDAAVQHAVGLFETMAARNGRIFRGPRHMARLADSAQSLGLAESLRESALLDAATLTLERNGLQTARVRLSLTGGDLNLLQSTGRGSLEPTVTVVAQPPTTYPDAFFEQGILAVVAEDKANPFDRSAGHKTINYWGRLRALQHAGRRGAGEAIWFDVANELVGGCVSNLFLVRDDLLLTPPARGDDAASERSAPVLPGITREAVLELAGDVGLEVERRALTVDDLLAADELFLTNSSWGVLPVRQLEAHVVGAGRPGPTTAALRAAWLELVERETGAAG